MQTAPGRVLRADAFEACCQCESAEVRTNLLLGGGWMSAEFESEAFLRSALIRPVFIPLPVLLGCREEYEYVSAVWTAVWTSERTCYIPDVSRDQTAPSWESARSPPESGSASALTAA